MKIFKFITKIFTKPVMVILIMIDNVFNHGIVENIVEKLPEGKNKKFLENECYNFCQRVNLLDYDLHFEDYKVITPKDNEE